MTVSQSGIPEGVAYLKVKEIARELRISKMTVYRLLQSGSIASIRVGRSYLVPVEAFHAYRDSVTYVPQQPPTA